MSPFLINLAVNCEVHWSRFEIILTIEKNLHFKTQPFHQRHLLCDTMVAIGCFSGTIAELQQLSGLERLSVVHYDMGSTVIYALKCMWVKGRADMLVTKSLVGVTSEVNMRWMWGIHCTQASEGIHHGFEIQDKYHQKSKTGLLATTQKYI